MILSLVTTLLITTFGIPESLGCANLSPQEASEALNFVTKIAFEITDLNRDGKATAAETKQAFCGGQCHRENNEIIDKTQEQADTNGDGGVSLSEIAKFMRDTLSDTSDPTITDYYHLTFKYLDTNEDGVLSRGDFGMLKQMCLPRLSQCFKIMPRFDCDINDHGMWASFKARTDFNELMSVVRKGQSGISAY